MSRKLTEAEHRRRGTYQKSRAKNYLRSAPVATGTACPQGQPDATRPAPDYLSPRAAALWKSVVANFELEEAKVGLLLLACKSLDRWEQARAVLDAEGLTYEVEGKLLPRPEAQIEAAAHRGYLSALRQLNLEEPAPEQKP